MVKARRFVLACLLGAGAAGLASPSLVHAAGCEAILGKWTWFTGGVVSIHTDGTMVHDPGNDGTWECTDRTRGLVTLRWRLGGYVNRLALSADGNGLSSTDPSQSFVTAKRGKDTPSRPAPSQPAPRAAEVPRPAPSEPPSTAPGPAPPRSGPAREGAGPCSGNACPSVKVLTEGGCVWLRNSVPAVLNVEVRLEKETLKMTLEAGDMTKAGPSIDASSPKTRRAGAASANPYLARTRHTTIYDVLSGSDRVVSEARVGTPAGCVAKPEAIVGYKASFASAETAKAFAFPSEPESVPCSGDACQDLDHGVEEIKACRLTNTGRREIKVGIVMNGNREPSMTVSVAPTKAMPLTYFTGCLRVRDIDRIEASYK